MAAPPPPSKKSRSTPRARSEGFRGFFHVDEATASRAVPYKPAPELSNIYFGHLHMDPAQREAISDVYAKGENFSQKFDVKDDRDQLTASAILAANRLDFDQLEALHNKWNCCWSDRDAEGKGDTRRVLYQW